MLSSNYRYLATILTMFTILFVTCADADVLTKNLVNEIQSGNISVDSIEGTGGSSGTVVDGYLVNNTNKEINLDVFLKDAIQLLNQGRGQNMYVLGVLGRSGKFYRSGKKSFIKLPPKKKIAVNFLSYCADFDKDNPSPGESFVISLPPQDMTAVLGRISSYHDKYPNKDVTKAAQVAIWIAQGKSPPEIRSKFEFSQVDLDLANYFVGK
ncbi:MAG: hypothetical protein HY892_04705 [Deltaproteobacteria bacterium]|nr:hypothetical protein [Deltaproteobacteria bacterium]